MLRKKAGDIYVGFYTDDSSYVIIGVFVSDDNSCQPVEECLEANLRRPMILSGSS